jgi:hypothetical protein
MCNCGTWARLPHQGTHDYKYPPPDHHPDCEDFKTERFLRVEYDGSWCVMEPMEASDLIGSGNGEYTTEQVFLTRDQFEKLPEFAGF